MIKKEKKEKKNTKKNKEKTRKKPLTLKKCKSKPNLKEDFDIIDHVKRKSLDFSEDEEVINIMQVRTLATPKQDIREGRECAIFGNFSNQYSHEGANATEIANNIVRKRVKSERNSIIISSSMPIIELKSISNDSSSDLSERQYSIKRKLKDLRSRVKQAKNIVNDKSNTELKVDIDIGLHKLIQWIQEKYFMSYFLSIKTYEKSKSIFIETPQLSGVNNNNNNIKEEEEEEKKSKDKKEDLEIVPSKLANEKKENKLSADMEGIWDNIECTLKNTEFLQDPEPLPPLAPFDDELLVPKSKSMSKSSGKQSSEMSSSIIGQLKNVQFPSVEYMSFGNIGEVTHEDLIDSPSLMSIASHNSSENIQKSVDFGDINYSLDEIKSQTEPSKPIFLNIAKHPSPILIDDEAFSASLSENLIAIKESSSIATPEAEEIEEFSSIDFDLHFKRPTSIQQEISLNPFSVSEETLELDEDEITKKALFCITLWIYGEILYTAVHEEFKKKYYHLIENGILVLHEVQVRTSVAAVMNFVDKIWGAINNENNQFIDWLKLAKNNQERLALIQENLENPRISYIIPLDILSTAENPSEFSISLSLNEAPSEPVKYHNKMIFDCINEYLYQIKDIFFPPIWRSGALYSLNIQAENVFQDVNQEIKKNCMVCAGRIPTIAMIGTNGQLDEDALQKIRENGLSLLLTSDLSNQEKCWTFYESEELQVEIDLSDILMEMLVIEACQILNY